jgi:putative cell wall-binding protein
VRTTSTARRAVLVVAAGTGLVLAVPAGAVPGFELTRLAGDNRFETAGVIARDSFPDADTVLLANGQSDDPSTPEDEERFADALAANYLAGDLAAPVLLTTQTVLPVDTEQALEDIAPTRIVIVGGPVAVSTAQEQALEADGYQVDRVSGRNRYETATAIARQLGAAEVGEVDGLRTAVVASGLDFPDALVTGPLAYAGRLPLLTTDPSVLVAPTRDLLEDFDVEQVLIPGGTRAVSQAVQDEIEDELGIPVRRFDGTVRTDTARLVAEYALNELGFSDEHVDLALGLRFPDALAGGPHAGAERAPILLTTNVDLLGAEARRYLEDHDDTLVEGHVFGGRAAVTDRVLAEAEQAGQGEAQPTTSPTPSATPTATMTPSPSSSPTTPGQCPGSPSPSASPSATPTATTSPTPPPSSDTPTAVTSRPELTTVELASGPSLQTGGNADARDDFCSISVRYVFDEPVIGRAPNAARFHLVGFDPGVRFTGRSALLEAGGTSVVVTFGRADDLTTTASERQDVGAPQLAENSLAVVDADAVASNPASAGDSGNPVADVPFGTSRSVPTFPAGITVAPDLVDVELGTTTAASTVVRYLFDEPVVRVASVTGFHVVTQSGRDVTCTSPTASGSQVSAICATGTADPVVRGFVASGSVSDATDGGNVNVLTAETVGSGVSEAPDLVRAEFRPGTAANNDDQVLFVFDEPVFVGDPVAFVVYQQDGDEVASTSASRQADATQVLATFPDEVPLIGARVPALPNAVGASVRDGAVIEAGGLNRRSQEDEVAVLNAARTGVTAGQTGGPDLVVVRVDTGAGTATFTFDEELDPTEITANRFVVTLPTGARRTCTQASPTDADGAPSDAPDSVTCTLFGTMPPLPLDGGVLGTADDGAVLAADNGQGNPEGGEGTSA